MLAVAGFVVGQTPAPGAGRGFTSWAYSEIATGPGVRLQLTRFEKHYDGTNYDFETCPGYSSIPGLVTEGNSSHFCYACFEDNKGFDTGFFFYYDILVPNGSGGWMPSGYWVDGAGKVPMMGGRRIDCTIKRSGSTDRANGAPFSCETSWTREGNVSEPHWKITSKDTIVIDASDSANVARAAQLIGDNCTAFDTARCNWTRTQKSSAYLPDEKDWVSLTNWADSCPPATKEFGLKFSNAKAVNWSDTFGGKISGKVKADAFISSLEVTVEADYHHSIGHSDSYTEEYTYSIPLGYQAALYLQHGMLEVAGDFSIITDSDRFLVKNAVFRFPLTKDVTVAEQRVRRGKVHHVDLPCEAKRPALGAPPPPNATIGE